MASSEGSSHPYDDLLVRLYTPDGKWTTLRTWSNMSTRNAWMQDTLNLSAFAGQTVLLRFQSMTDISLPSSFFIYDVVVK